MNDKTQPPITRDEHMTIHINVTDKNIVIKYEGHLDKATFVYVLLHELLGQYLPTKDGGSVE